MSIETATELEGPNESAPRIRITYSRDPCLDNLLAERRTRYSSGIEMGSFMRIDLQLAIDGTTPMISTSTTWERRLKCKD